MSSFLVRRERSKVGDFQKGELGVGKVERCFVGGGDGEESGEKRAIAEVKVDPGIEIIREGDV